MSKSNSKNQQTKQKPDYLYRNGVGIMIINKDKKIFVGKRIDNNSDAWQMPQGGLDAGESEDLAMLRELKEETGISDNLVRIITKSKKHHYYDLPYKLQKKFWGGKYLGQRQKWYLIEFLGNEDEINIKTEDPEFSEWKWVAKQDLLSEIVYFKRDLYENIVKEFEEFL
ncbi:MAG: RNA pyrophosphohydrolase [Rickettsiales bacterium]|nr:RNA pyrophosphohydrolase [Rickettsiales bacterium]